MARQLQSKYYSSAMRFTTSVFMRMKLDAVLRDQGCASQIFATHAEAIAFIAS